MLIAKAESDKFCNYHFYVDEIFVGEFTVWFNQPENNAIYFDDFAIFPYLQNRGYGTQMLKELIDLVHLKGFEKIALCVLKSNKYAIRMYSRQRFKCRKFNNFRLGDNNEHDYYFMILNLGK